MMPHSVKRLGSGVDPRTPYIKLAVTLTLLLGVICFLAYGIFEAFAVVPVKLWNPFLNPQIKGKEEIFSQDPNYPHVRDWILDHIYYSFYDGTYVYANQETTIGTVKRKPLRNEQLLFSQLRLKATVHLHSQGHDAVKESSCKNIRYRVIPSLGIEADVFCYSQGHPKHRVSLMIPLQEARVLFHHQDAHLQSLHLVMPLRGRLEAFKVFLENLSTIMAKYPRRLCFTVVYFEDGQSEVFRMELKTAQSSLPYLKSDFILINESVPFSRGRGLQVGATSSICSSSVVFFCDVDVLFHSDFLDRCLSNPVEGYQVYVPIVFSLYNPEFIYPLRGNSIPNALQQLEVKDEYGYWRVWGHGTLCIYKSDFIKIGGFLKKESWGGEDLDFMRKIIRHEIDYKVIRAVDPGLFHRYHAKDCGNSVFPSSSCMSVKASNEASKKALALWYFNSARNISFLGPLIATDEEEEEKKNFIFSDPYFFWVFVVLLFCIFLVLLRNEFKVVIIVRRLSKKFVL